MAKDNFSFISIRSFDVCPRASDVVKLSVKVKSCVVNVKRSNINFKFSGAFYINTDNPLYTDTRYNDKIRSNDN